MAYRTWNVDGHTVELEHGWWSGVATLTVDDELIFRRPAPLLFIDFGFAHRFEIDGLPCAARVVGQILNFRLELITGEDAESINDANYLPLEFPLGQVAIVGGAIVILIAMLAATITAIVLL